MAEIESSVLSRDCTGKPIATAEELVEETDAWETRRNRNDHTIHWQFTATQARTKLKSLYPENILQLSTTKNLRKSSVFYRAFCFSTLCLSHLPA